MADHKAARQFDGAPLAPPRQQVDSCGHHGIERLFVGGQRIGRCGGHVIDDPRKEVGFLSGGQKQAVAIARAVHFKRNILLLDEPTSALSVRETEHLLAYVRDLKKDGTSSVLVTHNLYHAFMVCDRFVVMSHGTKVFEANKKDTTIEEVTDHVIRT